MVETINFMVDPINFMIDPINFSISFQSPPPSARPPAPSARPKMLKTFSAAAAVRASKNAQNVFRSRRRPRVRIRIRIRIRIRTWWCRQGSVILYDHAVQPTVCICTHVSKIRTINQKRLNISEKVEKHRKTSEHDQTSLKTSEQV